MEDAEAAVAAGADAIGFIFWPGSPRYIDPFRARRLAAALPPFINTVGVFVDQELDHVAGVASLVRLSAIQLHGGETPHYAQALSRPILKAISKSGQDPFSLDGWPENMMLLLDAYDPTRFGGTGRTIDWDAAAAVASKRRVILSGGLNPENVADAVARVRPFGIDVSSGVEDGPGIKSRARICALFEALAARTPEGQVQRERSR
jgi:phosphoribosylanthranilate isomerase